jgi:hypothetical protein
MTGRSSTGRTASWARIEESMRRAEELQKKELKADSESLDADPASHAASAFSIAFLEAFSAVDVENGLSLARAAERHCGATSRRPRGRVRSWLCS